MARETMNGVEFRKGVLDLVNGVLEEDFKLNEKQVQAVIDGMRNMVVDTILDGKDIVLRDFIKFVGTEKEEKEKKVFGDKLVKVPTHVAISCKMSETVKKEVKERSMI